RRLCVYLILKTTCVDYHKDNRTLTYTTASTVGTKTTENVVGVFSEIHCRLVKIFHVY
uniref:Uncharacterized protein n=1 Tax=Oryza brachyantha TaxID=4533 RepID=J3MCK3_ORYBR